MPILADEELQHYNVSLFNSYYRAFDSLIWGKIDTFYGKQDLLETNFLKKSLLRPRSLNRNPVGQPV